MTDHNNSGSVDRPQTVIGPITLGLHHSGGTLSLHPNGTLGLTALGFGGAGTVEVLDLAVSAGTLTLDVSTAAGAATIAVSGLNDNDATPACPPGTQLTKISRTGGAVVVHLIEDGQAAAPAFPAAGAVSVSVTSADGI